MKATYVTLVSLLATSVAATPMNHNVLYSIQARNEVKQQNKQDNAKQEGAGKDKANEKAKDGAAGGAADGAAGGAKDEGKGNGNAKDGGKDAGKAKDGAAGGAKDEGKGNGKAKDAGKGAGNAKDGAAGGAKDAGKGAGKAKDGAAGGAKDAAKGAGNAKDGAAGGAKDAGKGAGNAKDGAAGGAKDAGKGAGGALVLPDGRIAKDAKPENFNVLASVFKSAVVKGDGLVFSDLINFPNVPASLFDKAGDTKAFAINIDDKSVFVPKGGEAQSNIRRADLLPSIRSQLNDVAVTGKRTLHFSVQRDAQKPLNATHDYQLVNLESKDFSFHQFDVRTGADNKNDIAVFGNSKAAGGAQKIFSTPFGEGKFENFALSLDFDANTMQVFHSTGNDALKQVTAPVKNDLAGLGEYHFALVKNPVGNAKQPTGIKEAIIFGGIFMEDSTNGKVTLK